MSLAQNWKALSARIRGLIEAGKLHADFLAVKSSDPNGRAKYLRTQCQKVVAELSKFESAYSEVLPAHARSALADFMLGPAQQIGPEGGSSDSIQERSWATLVKLSAFEAEFSYCLADTQAAIRARSERAFVHLQRLIAVDEDVQRKWSEALKSGEVRCEQLGAVHLLHHGIWAFKVHAQGARTDLVFQEPVENVAVPSGAVEGLVLTEWKVARTPAEGQGKFRQAQEQAHRYVGSAISGNELTTYRYAIVVSGDQIRPPSDVVVDGVTYRHVNLTTNPRVPSRS